MNTIEEFRDALKEAFAQSNIPGSLVYGEGPIYQPDLMLIGEAPGAQQELQGRPFVGKAGKNLDEFLSVIGLKRQEIYISNVVKIRPSKISPAGRIVNRPPNTSEKAFFIPWLLKEIELISPKMIVTLGNVALQVFSPSPIGAVHGQKLLISEANEQPQVTLFPLYHPASIIYNRALKAVYDEDLQALKNIIL